MNLLLACCALAALLAASVSAGSSAVQAPPPAVLQVNNYLDAGCSNGQWLSQWSTNAGQCYSTGLPNWSYNNFSNYRFSLDAHSLSGWTLELWLGNTLCTGPVDNLITGTGGACTAGTVWGLSLEVVAPAVHGACVAQTYWDAFCHKPTSSVLVASGLCLSSNNTDDSNYYIYDLFPSNGTYRRATFDDPGCQSQSYDEVGNLGTCDNFAIVTCASDAAEAQQALAAKEVVQGSLWLGSNDEDASEP